MKYAIFIRTYAGDYAWLEYCLRSLKKNAAGIPIYIATSSTLLNHQFDLKEAHWSGSGFDHADDYVGQQITKLKADQFVTCKPDYIIHIDSDTVLLDSFDKLFDADGKPFMLRTPYDQLPSDFPWKAPTEQHLGWGVSHEYMRRFPLVYPFGLYAELRQHLAVKNGGWENWVQSIKGRHLSEFNLLGAFAFENNHDEFHWIDTDRDELPPLIVKQNWSWGGIESCRPWLELAFPAS